MQLSAEKRRALADEWAALSGFVDRPEDAIIPNTVRVGFKTYEIHPWPAEEAHAEGSVGRCDPENGRILLALDRSPVDTAETLLHEVLHACWSVSHLEEGDGEERVVSTLASALAQVLRDNPDFRAYLEGVFSA